ncbi:MAG: DMT family transporter [Desulfovibrionaceae bacterium]|nr:DMT family transporter [Desulfovibrionaceae bacterium]
MAKTGYVMIILCAILFSLIGVISRVPLAEGLDPVEIAFWRATFGSVFFVSHGMLVGAWRIPAKQRAIFTAFGIPGVGILFFLYVYGVQHAGASMTCVLNNTFPIWVAIWAYLFFNEAMTGQKITSVALAVAGASLIAVSGGGLPEGASPLGIAAACGTGFLFSLHSLVVKKYVTQNVSPVSLYMHILPAGALCILPFVDFMPGKSLETWVSLISLGLFCNWLPYLCFCGALKRLPATRVSVIESSGEPLLTVLFAFIFWGEVFSPVGWLGAIMVISAVVIIITAKEVKRRPAVENRVDTDRTLLRKAG